MARTGHPDGEARGALIAAGWFPEEATAICAYARDSGLPVTEVEELARRCFEDDAPIRYWSLHWSLLDWHLDPSLSCPAAA